MDKTDTTLYLKKADQNSKFEIWFLLNACCFTIIIMSENCKSSPCKLGAIYTQSHNGAVFFPYLDPKSETVSLVKRWGEGNGNFMWPRIV